MTIRSLSILDNDGEVLLHRNFIGYLTTASLQMLKLYVLKSDFQQPLDLTHGICIVHKQISTLHLICTCNKNGDAMATCYFLEKLIEIMKMFIPGFLDYKTLKGNFLHISNSDSSMIQKNQIQLQEMIEEMIDNGDVVTTDPEVIKLFINVIKPKVTQEQKAQLTIQATKQSSYRPANLLYKTNTAKLKVYEQLSCTVDAQGKTLEAISQGQIEMISQLSGMPDCTITLNDKVSGQLSQITQKDPTQTTSNTKSHIVLEDIQFHHCVKMNKVEAQKQITFVPPDGSFTLMKFVITNQVSNPFSIHVMTQDVSKHSFSGIINIKTIFPEHVKAEDLVMKIPMPNNIHQAICSTTKGSAKLLKNGKEIHWKLDGMAGQQDAQLKFTIQSVTGTNANDDLREWKKPVIQIDFDIRNYTASGVQVMNLSIHEHTGYETAKCMKTKTGSGFYSIKW